MVRRFLYLRLLRGVLVIGGLYDLGFSLLLATIPGRVSEFLRVPLPAQGFWVQLTAVFLLALGFLHVAAAREPRRYSAVIAAAVATRFLAAAVLAAAAWSETSLAGLWAVAGVDFAFSVATGSLWMAWRR